MNRRLLPLVVAWFSLLVLVGCGSDSHKTYTVSGTVTLDGDPVPEGDIIFEPLDTQYGADAGKIADGKFEFSAKAGKHKVRIQASKMVKLPPGKRGAMGETEIPQEYIPDKYNSDTTLTAEVDPDGDNEFEFDLKSK